MLALTWFCYVSQEICESLFAEANQDSTFSHTRENSKMFNINSNYFSFFNNTPPASKVKSRIIKDFLTCNSCLYYRSMVELVSYY